MSTRPQISDLKPLQSSTAMYSLSSQARKEIKKTGSRKATVSCTGHGWEHRQCWQLPGHLPYLTDRCSSRRACQKEGSQSQAKDNNLMGWVPWDLNFYRQYSPSHCRTTGSRQHDEWHKVWPPVKFFKVFFKKRTKENKKHPLLCTESKITVKDPNFVHFFKGKANIIWQYLQFRVQHILLLHSRKKKTNKK